jgi:hypothetical protein
METNNFYSFRKIIKEDLYKTTLEELIEKIAILYKIMKNDAKQTPEKLASDWFEEFQRLIALADDIIKNRCQDEPDRLYGYGENVKFDDELIMIVKRVNIARLACFLVDHQDYLFDNPEALHGMVAAYIQVLDLFGSSMYRNKYCTTQFIHSSRGLLDTENPETGINLMGQLMLQARVYQYELNDEERKIFNVVNTFWKDIVIGSASFGKAIERFKDCYKIDLPIKDIRDFLNSMQIEFVRANAYYGMVGFNGIILSTRAFEELDKDNKDEELDKDNKHEELAMRFILTTIIHECAHYILRIVRDDFGFLTPRNGHNDEKRQRLEAGYFLEDILFGNAWKQVSTYQLLMKPEIWEKDIPIIPDDELTKLTSKSKKDNLCASGFLMAKTKKWM